MDDALKQQHAEREAQVSHAVSTLKSLADLTEGGNPRRAVERLAAKAVVSGIRSIQPASTQVKQASGGELSAVALAAMAEIKAGPAFLDFEPQTLRELGFDDREVAKIMAAKVVLYDHTPFYDWHVFEKVVVTFNGRDAVFDVTQEPSIAEIAWAVDEMRYIDDQTTFSPEVCGYIAVAASREGLVAMPQVLKFAEGVLTAQISGFGRSVADQFSRGEKNDYTKVQFERIAAINEYVNERHRKLVSELRALKR